MENVRFSIIENDLKWNSESDQAADQDADLLFEKSSVSSEANFDADFSKEAQKIFDRQQQTKNLWRPQEIERTLCAMPNAKHVVDMVKTGCILEVIPDCSDYNLALICCSIYGNVENIMHLLCHFNADPNATDNRGRTPLHFACFRGNAPIAKVLLDRGSDPNRWDARKEVTPLHCAASSKSVECILLLLRRKANINIGIEKLSALHYAIDGNAVDCVEILLKYGADPNTPQVYTETPLHTASALGFTKCVQLLLSHHADVRSQFYEGKVTALHLAAENDYVDCARLLLEHKADVDCRNASQQTPLHIACLTQSIATVHLLISYGANVNATYREGRTALHAAIVKKSDCLDCCYALLSAGADVNKADHFGFTPLHAAAFNEYSKCVFALIEHGADVTARTDGRVSALSFIVRRTPEIIPKLMNKFSSSIKAYDHELGNVDCQIYLDFQPLVPNRSMERGETELLLALIEVGQKRILMHPLCETFLFLKWRRIRKFFLMSLAYHTIFVLLFTLYVIGVFARSCKDGANCIAASYVSTICYFVIILNCILLGKELFQMAHGLHGYAKYWENWLQWSIVFGVFLCVSPEIVRTGDLRAVPIWQHHVAAVVILLVWLELMMLVGRFPIFGIYVQMFTKVAVNFGKFMLAYICLFVAFGLSFAVLFNDYPAFENITWSFLKTITMMSGELEFEDIFYGDYAVKFPVTAHIIFLSFVLLVTVILTNLMVGLAVSDIQGLQVSASLDRQVRQAELVSRLESLFFSRLLRNAPAHLIQLCKRSALLSTSRDKLQFAFRPNDPRDNQLPENIKLNIYKLVAERRDRNQSLRRHQFENNYNIFSRSLQRQQQCQQSQRDESDTNQNKPSQQFSHMHELLRPRSATNVPQQLQQEHEMTVILKNHTNALSDVRVEVQALKAQLGNLVTQFEQLSKNVKAAIDTAEHG